MSNQRDREAILTVMRQMDRPVTYSDISLRAGERLAGPLMEMVQEGKVIRIEPNIGETATYRLPI